MTNTIDPLGGSFFVEAQTDRIEAQAYDYFRRIEELGGVIPAIEKGFFQSEISDAAYRYQREIDDGHAQDRRRECLRGEEAAHHPHPGDGPAGL